MGGSDFSSRANGKCKYLKNDAELALNSEFSRFPRSLLKARTKCRSSNKYFPRKSIEHRRKRHNMTSLDFLEHFKFRSLK